MMHSDQTHNLVIVHTVKHTQRLLNTINMRKMLGNVAQGFTSSIPVIVTER